MKLLFVQSNKLGSRLIRWGLNSDCSHFALCFDEGSADKEPDTGIVFHSYGKGTQLGWLRSFLQHVTVVHCLELRVPLTLEEEEAVYKAILSTEADRYYDYPALLWFSWRVLLWKVLRLKVEGVNRWQTTSNRLCTGIIPAVQRALQLGPVTLESTQLMSPHAIFESLKGHSKLREDQTWKHQVNNY